jgi:hypothetical protein
VAVISSKVAVIRRNGLYFTKVAVTLAEVTVIFLLESKFQCEPLTRLGFSAVLICVTIKKV